MSSQSENLLAPQAVYFEEEEAYLVLHLDMADFDLQPTQVDFRGKSFQPKDELHITILSRRAASAVQDHLEENPGDSPQIHRLIEQTDWSYRQEDHFFHVVEEPGVESIIQLVQVLALQSFFQELSRIIAQDLEPPPAHVTLYTFGDPKGIGIPTQADFEQLVVEEIDLAELQPAFRSDVGPHDQDRSARY
jgi:hypothetical protein